MPAQHVQPNRHNYQDLNSQLQKLERQPFLSSCMFERVSTQEKKQSKITRGSPDPKSALIVESRYCDAKWNDKHIKRLLRTQRDHECRSPFPRDRHIPDNEGPTGGLSDQYIFECFPSWTSQRILRIFSSVCSRTHMDILTRFSILVCVRVCMSVCLSV